MLYMLRLDTLIAEAVDEKTAFLILFYVKYMIPLNFDKKAKQS